MFSLLKLKKMLKLFLRKYDHETIVFRATLYIRELEK